MAQENLGAATKKKYDEFYTQYHDIEKEMNAYLDYDKNVFRDKTILLPCDDPRNQAGQVDRPVRVEGSAVFARAPFLPCVWARGRVAVLGRRSDDDTNARLALLVEIHTLRVLVAVDLPRYSVQHHATLGDSLNLYAPDGAVLGCL